MRKTMSVAVMVLVGIVAGHHALRAQQAPQPPAPANAAGPAPALRELYQERVKAARAVIEVLDQRFEAGEALTPTMIDLQHESFRRLAEAETAAAEDKAGRVTAAGQYVRRCEQILKIIESRFQHGLDTSKVQVNQAKYHLSDAKVRLAEAMAQ